MTKGRYIGEFRGTLDGEGRIQLPAALKDEMNVRRPEFQLMANLQPDGSLCLREGALWESYVSGLRSQAPAGMRADRTLLFLAANSSPVRCDKLGRVRIPDNLLQLADLDRNQPGRKELVLVGNFDDLRVWAPSRWHEFREDALADYAQGLEALVQALGA